MAWASAETQNKITHKGTHTHTHLSLRPVHLTSGRPICQSPSLCTFHCPSLKCKCTLFHLIHSHWGIIIFGILQSQSHDGAVIERRTSHSACHSSLKDYNAHLSVCVRWLEFIDLPSFDVVQEGDFNVHQEWQQRYLWVKWPESALVQWQWLLSVVSDATNKVSYSFRYKKYNNWSKNKVEVLIVLHFSSSSCISTH